MDILYVSGGVFRKLHLKQSKHSLFAVSLTPHLDKHVFRKGVEVAAGMLLRVALPGAAGACYHPVVVKAFKVKRHGNHEGVNVHPEYASTGQEAKDRSGVTEIEFGSWVGKFIIFNKGNIQFICIFC